jgi:hypothetical protein
MKVFKQPIKTAHVRSGKKAIKPEPKTKRKPKNKA